MKRSATCHLPLRMISPRQRWRVFLWWMFCRSLAQSVFMLLVMPWMMRFLVLWHWFRQRLWLRWVRLKGGVYVGGGPRRPKVGHCVQVKTAGGRSFRSTPWASLHSSVRGTLEHGWPLHWRAFERWHQFHGVLVTWMCLHAAVTREPRTTSPLQLRDSFMSHFVKRFVKQTIPKEKLELEKPPVSVGFKG